MAERMTVALDVHECGTRRDSYAPAGCGDPGAHRERPWEPEGLAAAQEAAEAAWRELDAAQRGLPDCEHTRAWRKRIADAQTAHTAALRARDRLLRQQADRIQAATGGGPA